ncbi:11575_t:CDS:1, partial [Cetraspora pellucida]
MSKYNHPIYTKFVENTNYNTLICLECNHVYHNSTKATTLKGHYISKHKEIWKNIRLDEGRGGYKKRHKKKWICYAPNKNRKSSITNIEDIQENRSIQVEENQNDIQIIENQNDIVQTRNTQDIIRVRDDQNITTKEIRINTIDVIK